MKHQSKLVYLVNCGLFYNIGQLGKSCKVEQYALNAFYHFRQVFFSKYLNSYIYIVLYILAKLLFLWKKAVNVS